MPQFIMFSLYITSDSLAILLGAVLALKTWHYVRSPNWGELLLLALTLVLGLLTKTTFVAAIPVLLVLVYWYPRENRRGWTNLLRADVFLIIVLALGSYKFVDNLLRYRDPFFNNMNLGEDWHLEHMQTYRGLFSFVDINIGRLLISPIASPVTEGSYPVLLYGTFWYQHIPESNFTGLMATNYRYLGSFVFIFALIPSWFFFRGMARLALGLPALIRNFDATREQDKRQLTLSIMALIIVSSLALLTATVWQYHEWSILQGRFLFPWFFAGMGAFSVGFGTGRGRVTRILQAGILVLAGLSLLFFAGEFSLILWPMLLS